MKYERLKKQIEKHIKEDDKEIYIKHGACIYKIKSVKNINNKILIDIDMEPDDLLINLEVKYK